MYLKHKAISKSRKHQLQRIMIAGNTELVALHERVLKRRDLINREYSRSEFRQQLFANLRNGIHEVEGVKVSKKAIVAIRAVQAIQDELIFGHVRLMRNQARKWARKAELGYPTVGDFQAEACCALIEAIYGYHKHGVKFITYATTCVSNHLLECLNDANPFSKWTNLARELNAKMQMGRIELNRPHNFEELCEHLGLTPKHQKILLSTMTHLIQFVPVHQHESGGDDNNDYTAYGKPVWQNEPEDESINPFELLSQVELNEDEQQLVDCVLQHGKQWVVQFSETRDMHRSNAYAMMGRLKKKVAKQLKAAAA